MIEHIIDGAKSALVCPIIISYEMLFEGHLHEFLSGKAKKFAYIKVIEPETKQVSKSYKVRTRRLKVRLDGNQIKSASKTVNMYQGADKVIDGLKSACKREIKIRIVPRIAHHCMHSILGGELCPNIENPHSIPCVLVECDFITKAPNIWRRGRRWGGSSGCDRRGRNLDIADDERKTRGAIAYDGTNCYEIIGNKVHKLDMPPNMHTTIAYVGDRALKELCTAIVKGIE